MVERLVVQLLGQVDEIRLRLRPSAAELVHPLGVCASAGLPCKRTICITNLICKSLLNVRGQIGYFKLNIFRRDVIVTFGPFV